MGVKFRSQNTSDGDKFLKQLEELKKLQVRIGFQSGEATDDKGVDYTDIAAWNELGNSRVPSRPFMRNAIDNHTDQVKECVNAQVEALANGATARQVLEETGLFVKDLVQNEITTGSFVPNSPATIRKKGSDKPLIDTGRLRESVNYVIKPKGSDS